MAAADSTTTKKFARHHHHLHDSGHAKPTIKRDGKTEMLGSSPRGLPHRSSSSSHVTPHNNSSNTRPAAAGTAAGKASSFLQLTSKDKTEKKEKKVYELPGQKHDPPDERDPLRIFYQSLYRENPKSEMAQIWMMEHGLLGHDAAKRALEIRKRNQLVQKLGPTSKLSKNTFQKQVPKLLPKKTNSTTNGSNKGLPNVKRKPWDDSDDDLILKPRKKLNAKC